MRGRVQTLTPCKPAIATYPARGSFWLGATLLVLHTTAAAAFPLIDPSNQAQVPNGTELATPDAQDLQHQLQIANGLAPPPGGGWSFVPRLDMQEMLTDNVYQLNTPRRWDMVTYVAPGFGVAADTARLQLSFDYQPTLALYARTGPLNALTQQFTGTGLLTVVPDLAFVDVRALSGVNSLYGGFGGLGTIGASPAAVNASAASLSSLAGNSLGLSKDNEVQTSSYAISPYLLHRFGDWGTGKLGYSLSITQSSDLTGFASSPLPTNGANAQTVITNEEVAHFATGDFLGKLQNAVDVDLLQSTINSAAGFGYSPIFDGPSFAEPANDTTSNRAYLSDTVSYQVNRALNVFASIGHENILYDNLAGQTVNLLAGPNGSLVPSAAFAPPIKTSINDATWSFGATVTPNPDSLLTVSYGHLNGFNSFTANGHYALTARTVLTVSYLSSLGTQLENLQNQLGLATTNTSGSLVNGQTGGPLFGNINALAVQNGLFRTDTLTLSGQTSLDRDIISAAILLTKQSQQAGDASSLSKADTFSLQWTHQIHPALALSSAFAYSIQDQLAGTAVNFGNSRSIATSVALQYQISKTLASSLRYSLFDRQSTVTAYSVLQNMLILGISKTF